MHKLQKMSGLRGGGKLTALLASEEWIASQDWSKSEEPSPVQVALKQLRTDKAK